MQPNEAPQQPEREVASPTTRYWKAAALLVLFFAAISYFFWGPELSGEPETDSAVNVPSMENLPRTTTDQMSLEVKPEESENKP